MIDLAVCHHEAGHAVLATVFHIPWRAVSVNGHDGKAGRLYPDAEEIGLMTNDPIDGNWALQSFAMMAQSGPLAEARYQCESLDPKWLPHIDFSQYGSKVDFESAQTMADEAGVKFEALIKDAADMLTHDKIWMAVDRIANQLAEKRVLLPYDVDRLVGLKR